MFGYRTFSTEREREAIIKSMLPQGIRNGFQDHAAVASWNYSFPYCAPILHEAAHLSDTDLVLTNASLRVWPWIVICGFLLFYCFRMSTHH